MAASPEPAKTGAFSSTLYSVIEDLKNDAVGVFGDIENDVALADVAQRLGELRDRADAIQTVVIQHIESINNYL